MNSSRIASIDGTSGMAGVGESFAIELGVLVMLVGCWVGLVVGLLVGIWVGADVGVGVGIGVGVRAGGKS